MQNFINPYNIPTQNLYTPRTPEERTALLGGSTGANEGAAYKDDAALAEALRAQLQAQPAQPKPMSGLYEPSLNPLNNISGNLKEWGTGLNYLGHHPIEWVKDYAKGIGQELTDWGTDLLYNYNPVERTAKGAADAINILNPFRKYINYEAFKNIAQGKDTLGNVAANALAYAYAKPVDFALDMWVLKDVVGVGSKAVKKSVADTAEDAINLMNAKVKSEGFKVLDASKEFNAFPKNIQESAIRAFETGEKVSNPQTKKALKTLEDYSNKYDNLVKEMSPDTWVPENVLTTNQKLVRDGVASSYAEADKLTARLFNDESIFKQGAKAGEYGEVGLKQGLAEIEGKVPVRPLTSISSRTRTLTKEGAEKLEALAKDGDDIAARVLEAQKLHEKGWLKSIPHGLAEVDNTLKTLDVLKAAAARSTEAGKFAERVYGTAEYSDIAKQLTRPSEWLDAQMKGMVEDQLGRELGSTGAVGGIKIALDTPEKGAKFLNRATLQEGKLTSALDAASDVAKAADDIPISRAMYNTLKDQISLNKSSNVFGDGILADIFRQKKSVDLASFRYLVGNFLTAGANFAMDEIFNPVNMIRDFGAALTTKGNLLKEMGIYRPVQRRIPRFSSEGFAKFNKYSGTQKIGDVVNYLDAKIQNIFAEAAAHAKLRREGIKAGQRLDSLMAMDGEKLADVIRHTARIGNLFTSHSIIPQKLRQVLAVGRPFWRWPDVAAQSTMYMMKQHPLLSAYVMIHGLAESGFNQEMLNRAGLQVQSDKPYVTYRVNPRTGKMQESSMEFVPMMNTIKMTSSLLDGDFEEAAGVGVPYIMAMSNVFRGLDRYGRPIKRPEMSSTDLQNVITVQGSKRYKWVPGQGFTQEVGFMPDEVISTFARETWAVPNLVNNTVLPFVAGLTGNIYYKPMGNAVLGTMNRAGYGQLPLQAGNPRQGQSTQEMLDWLRGSYAQEYYPEREFTTPSQNRRMFKGAGRRYIQDMEYIR